MSQPVQKKLLERIYGMGRGCVFTPNHFLDLGKRSAIDLALRRLAAKGTIRHLARGLYDYPSSHPKLGLLSPDPEKIAQAISKKDGSRLQPSGAYAVNLLGLSQQVPAKIVYLTDGPAKSIEVGEQRIQLKPTTLKNMTTAGRVSGLVIQAFRHLGKGGVTAEHLATLLRILTEADREKLWKDRIYAPTWMHRHFEGLRPSSSSPTTTSPPASPSST